MIEYKENDMSANVDNIGPLLDKIKSDRGLDFTQYRENTIRRRMSRRMAARDCSDLQSYISLLDCDPSEYDYLLRDLTIKYTEFFRDPFVFDILRERILPAILRCKSANDQLRVWSAGCATGEEAYSLAVTVRQLQAEAGNRCPVRILGTDIDGTAIDVASRGIYKKAMLPVLPDERAMGLFRDHGETIEVLPEVRNSVTFQVHNLLAGDARESICRTSTDRFDLVLCRNVMIYLKRATQARVVELLVDMLVPGGFLVAGTGENIPDHLKLILATVDQKAKVFRLAR